MLRVVDWKLNLEGDRTIEEGEPKEFPEDYIFEWKLIVDSEARVDETVSRSRIEKCRNFFRFFVFSERESGRRVVLHLTTGSLRTPPSFGVPAPIPPARDEPRPPDIQASHIRWHLPRSRSCSLTNPPFC